MLNSVDPFSYQITPDLGLMYLASSVRNAGLSVSLKDLRRDRWSFERLEKYVRAEQPMIAGVKCYSREVKRVKRMSELIRKACPETRIVIGGPHPSMDPVGTLSVIPEADDVFLGESEFSFRDFALWVKASGKGPPPESIPGIAYQEGGRAKVREPVFENDLEQLPLPAWDLLPPTDYPDETTGIFAPGFPIAPMMLSRGCPFGCSYCGAQYVMGRSIRYRPVANILEEIALLEREYGVRNFSFVDDNFTCQREKAGALFEALAKREKRIAFTFPNGVRPNTLDAGLLKIMEKAGCYSIALGIESASDEILSRMKKKQTREEIVQAVNLIRSTTAIKVTGFFILGYPGESLRDIQDTINFAADLPLHHPHFCLFTPLPGTPVYQELQEQGLIPAQGLDPEHLTFDQPFALPGIPPKKLLRLHQSAYLKFYLKPWRIWNLLQEIRSAGNLWMIIRRAIKLLGK